MNPKLPLDLKAADGRAPVVKLIRELDKTQWFPEVVLKDAQFRQLAVLAVYVAQQSDGFAQRLRDAGMRVQDVSNPAAFRQLPPMTRRDIQDFGPRLFCRAVPPSHAPASEARTSGSTGEPLVVMRTLMTSHYWMAFSLRDHFWHKRDFSGSLAVIRGGVEPASNPDWGPPVSLFFNSGPSHVLPINRNIAEQADWLAAHDPDYILIYPNVLAALLDHFEANRIQLPRLRQLRMIAETMPPHLPARARAVLGVDTVDLYSSQEVGVIALQCPISGLYHVMAENLIVEILDAAGDPCPAGVTGRVVITDLHNFATPLIRYDIGDWAAAGPPCPCGRGLPTLTRIWGKSRNMMIVDGGKRWPMVGGLNYDGIAPIRQCQFIQKSKRLIEVRVVVDPAPTPSQEMQLRDLLLSALGQDFDLNFIYYPDRLPPRPNGKLEDFICEIDA